MNLSERRNKDPHQMAMFKKMKTDHKLLEYCAEHHQPQSLDKTFEDIIKPKCANYPLWKIGIYYSHIEDLSNQPQGNEIESIFGDIFDSIKVSDKIANQINLMYGLTIKYDFIMPNKVPIQFKSSLREKGIFDRRGNIKPCNTIKIFDTSRRKYNSDQLSTLKSMLDDICWDINLLFFTYDKEKQMGCLCFTSLTEICEYMFDSVTKENILNLFSFNEGASHYFINRHDIFKAAKSHKRIIRFMVPDNEEENNYTKSKKVLSPLDKVFGL